MRIRTWVCPCCSLSYRRYKNDSKAPYCGNCDRVMVQGRTYHRKIVCKCQRTVVSINRNKNILYSKVRNCGGEVLKISKETNEKWREVNGCCHRDSLIKYANIWLKSLAKDVRNNPEDKDFRIVNDEGKVEKVTSRMLGVKNVPEILYMEVNYKTSTKGEYNRCFIKGILKIDLNKNYSVEEIRDTLLHEVVHFIDDEVGIKCNHDVWFFRRVDWMKSKFPVQNKWVKQK